MQGTYDRSTAKKKTNHPRAAWEHLVELKATGFSNTCAAACPYNLECPMKFSGMELLAIHEEHHGHTSAEQKEDGSVVYRTGIKARETSNAWRRTMNTFFTYDGKMVKETYTVRGVEVCQGFARNALGVPGGTWLLNQALARKGPNQLLAKSDHQEYRRDAAAALSNVKASSFQATVAWFLGQMELWDFMPNERLIVHPHLVWATYYIEFYLPDFAAAFTVPPLTCKNSSKCPGRWFEARAEAVRQV
tara:strand:+ start:823 stop:1563 length:741 start_codon:yes stop_codon:yes gene_type:complete